MKPNRGDQFFAETILRQYQERTGKTNEAIKIFTEVFRKSVANTMLQFRQSYREIFNELPIKSSEEFYKMIFGSSSKGLLEDIALPPCLTKDFYDGNLDKIKTGGRGSLQEGTKFPTTPSKTFIYLAFQGKTNFRIIN